MNKRKKAEFILVFDRYFTSKPNAVLSVLKRTLYACAECVCMMFCLLGIYSIYANPWIIAGCCVVFTAFFSFIFCFVRKRFAVPAFALIIALIIYENIEAVTEKLTYFIDAVFRAMDGIVFGMNRYMWHRDLTENVESEVIFALIGVSCVLSLICAGAMFRKPSGVVPLITFIVLFAPMGIAQNLSFNLWVVPTTALLLGGFAVSKAFSSGVITRGGVYEGCRRAFIRKERSFGSGAAKASVIESAGLNAVHYSKYFSAAVCAAAVFTATGFLGSIIMDGRGGIDYSGVYEYFANIGRNVSPSSGGEETGFPDLGFLTDEFNQSLGIVSPGVSEREVLKVQNFGPEVYLRGDIGVDFNGLSWSSHLSGLFNSAKDVPGKYRPAEIRLLRDLENSFRNKYPSIYVADIPESYLSAGEGALVRDGKINLEYLTRTNVVFLPAYVDGYSVFYGAGYDIYGDYVVRSRAEKIEDIGYTALVPSLNYTGYGAEDKLMLVSAAQRISEIYEFANTFDTNVVPDWSGAGIYKEYLDYVHETYLDVPDSLRGDLTAFLKDNGLYSGSLSGDDNIQKYSVCVEITDFLKDNYAYSLNTDNGLTDPVMTFLTETKSGHCALYASAMTLMLRSMDIPARYCTGFIAPHTDYGNTAVLKSKNLHAWCEVYFDEIGWITFDPTGSSVSGDIEIVDPFSGVSSSSETESSDSEISDDSESSSYTDVEDPATDSDDESDTDPEDYGDDSDDSDFGGSYPHDEHKGVNVLPYVIASAAAVLLIALAVISVYKFRKLDKEAKNVLEKSRSFGSCEELYAKIIEVLKLCGFRQNSGEQPERFFLRADKHFKTKLSKHAEMLMKIAFGNAEFSGDEVLKTALLLNSLFEAADSQLVVIGRVRLRKIIINKILP
ncbi:MAG: transglutaminase domain-containing protein [Oscillospiraceae bacterium]|nr:transglutaminase domain-containing protein [Oscillospiraceae bacterium]